MGLQGGEANHSFLLSILVWLVQQYSSTARQEYSVLPGLFLFFHPIFLISMLGLRAGENTFVNCSKVTTPAYKSPLSLSLSLSVEVKPEF